ncbi:hypothetical protein EYF80_036496 [Liparis tanakae]|uniref:Uncharacterized protein n=1 Tax=Liparis tanakae TaxID=230148 RepID=A0A4Z2GKX5_9TELE|nr:hypothetical protein EYF80_036496 [Liparis tanakae]
MHIRIRTRRGLWSPGVSLQDQQDVQPPSGDKSSGGLHAGCIVRLQREETAAESAACTERHVYRRLECRYVRVCLRHGIREPQLKVLASQRVVPVVLHQGEHAGEVQVGRQVEVRERPLCNRADATVLDSPVAPEVHTEKPTRHVNTLHTVTNNNTVHKCAVETKVVGVAPEGEGEGVAGPDQEAAVAAPGLRAVVVDQPLGRQPALLQAAVEPRLRAVQVLVLRRGEPL